MTTLARHHHLLLIGLTGLVGALTACDVSLDVEGSRFACETDDDCASGFTCAEVGGVRQCVGSGEPVDTDQRDMSDTAGVDVADDTAEPDTDTSVDTTGGDADTTTDTGTVDMGDTCVPPACAGDTAALYLVADIAGPGEGLDVGIEIVDPSETVIATLDVVLDRDRPRLVGPVEVPADTALTARLEGVVEQPLTPLSEGEVRVYVASGNPLDGGALSWQFVSRPMFDEQGATLAALSTVESLERLQARANDLEVGFFEPGLIQWSSPPLFGELDIALEFYLADVPHGRFMFSTGDSRKQLLVVSGDAWAERLLRIDLETDPVTLEVFHTVTCRAFFDLDCVDGQWCLPTTVDPDGDVTGQCTTPGGATSGADCGEGSTQVCAADHMCRGGICQRICSVSLDPSCGGAGSCQSDGNPLYDVCSSATASDCTPSSQTGCPDGERCVINDDGTGGNSVVAACTELIGPQQPGEACIPGECVAGAQCVNDPAEPMGDTVCIEFCSVSDDTCPAGTSCVSWSNVGVEGLPDDEGFCFD